MNNNNINHGDYIEVSEDVSPVKTLMEELDLLWTLKVMARTKRLLSYMLSLLMGERLSQIMPIHVILEYQL